MSPKQTSAQNNNKKMQAKKLNQSGDIYMDLINECMALQKARANLHRNPSELKQRQLKKFREIVEFAYCNVPFYHQKLNNKNIRPSDIRSLEDSRKIPPITKAELQTHRMDEIKAKNIDLSKCQKDLTSGSTGIPLAIYFGKKTLSIDYATWRRAFFQNGMRLRDKRVTITDLRHMEKNVSWTQKLGILKRKYCSMLDSPKTQFNYVKKESPEILEGYPSSLAILANYCKDNGCKLSPRMVMTNSESLDMKTRELVISTFETELFDYYGSTEFSLIAWECKAHSGYHINADNLLVEFVKDDEPVSSGERGEIVLTSLTNHEMPLIRYKIGDIGIKKEGNCSCGVTLPCMKAIEGRRDDFLVTSQGDIISPTLIFPYPFDNIENIRQFRITQETINKLTIQLSLKKDPSAGPNFERAEDEIHRIFGQDVQVEFQIKDDLGRDPNNKFRKVISRIPRK